MSKRDSLIFTNKEIQVMSEREHGIRTDSTGIFSARIKPKIKELINLSKKIEWYKKLIGEE